VLQSGKQTRTRVRGLVDEIVGVILENEAALEIEAMVVAGLYHMRTCCILV